MCPALIVPEDEGALVLGPPKGNYTPAHPPHTRFVLPTSDLSSRERILHYLDRQGGAIANDEGRGLTQALADAAGYADLSVLNGMLSRLEKEGVLRRDIRGRRTYRIELVGRAAPRSSDGRGAAPTQASNGRGRSAGAAAAPAATASEVATEVASRLSDELADTRAALASLQAEVRVLSSRIDAMHGQVADLAGVPARVEALENAAGPAGKRGFFRR